MLMTLTMPITTRPLIGVARAAEAGDADALDHDGGEDAELDEEVLLGGVGGECR